MFIYIIYIHMSYIYVYIYVKKNLVWKLGIFDNMGERDLVVHGEEGTQIVTFLIF